MRASKSKASPRNSALVAVVLAVAACGSAPAPAAAAPGVDTPVEILDRDWVRFEGQRRPIEYLLLEVRERVRAAPARTALPCVIVRVAAGAPGIDARWLGWLRNELDKAGVNRIVFGGE